MYIPLAEFAHLIDLAINTYPNEQRADGFIFDEAKTFYLDLLASSVQIGGTESSFDSDSVQVYQSDIYIDANLFKPWFDFKLDIDLYSSKITIISDKKLPFQEKIDRESRQKKLDSYKASPLSRFKRTANKYADYDTPKINQSLKASITKTPNTDYTLKSSYSSRVYGDLLNMNSSLFLAGSDSDLISNVRLSLTRKYTTPIAYKNITTTEYVLGSITEPRAPLINQSSSQVNGILISNFPLQRQLEFNKHTFIGDLLPNWEVELYRNNALIGFQSNDINGQYIFEDIPILFGTNSFRLVFYGPLGQKREEERRFDLSNSMTTPGKQFYKVSLSQDKLGQTRSILQYDIGLLPKLSSRFFFTSIPVENASDKKTHQYLYAGLQTYWQSLFADIGIVKDFESGAALLIEAQTRWDDYIIGLKQSFYDNYQSELVTNLKSRFELNINTFLSFETFSRIPLTFRYSDQTQIGNVRAQTFSNQITVNKNHLSFNNSLNWNQSSNTASALTGTFQASSNAEFQRARLNINYEVQPISRLSQYSIDYNLPIKGDIKYKVNVAQDILGDTTSFTATANTIYEQFQLSSNLLLDDKSNFSISFSASFSYGINPISNKWLRNSQAISQQGALQVEIYQDDNQNGKRDKEELGLEHIGVVLNNSKRPERTNKDGFMYVSNIKPWAATDVQIAIETIQDPLLQSKNEGENFVFRPGHTNKISFPVILTGEIDGTIYLSENDDITPMSNVDIELLDKNQKIIKTTRSSFDGYYLFTGVPTGRYNVRVSPTQIKKFNLYVDKPFEIFMSAPDNLFIIDQNFLLKKLSP